MQDRKALYLHVPFCRKKCLYCDFFSFPFDKGLASEYIDVLTGAINSLNEQFVSIYIGGGTPTVLAARDLKKLLKSLSRFLEKDTEFTIEANPESLDQDKLRVLFDSGVNRISIGVQSLKDDKLLRLGRIHNRRKALNSVYLAKKAGFKNISVDLIFGVWQETLKSWEDELKEVVKLPIKHISCYCLSYEPGTKIYSDRQNNIICPLDDKMCAKMYKLGNDLLRKHGFLRYEVSNFAMVDYACRNNLNYWNNGSYIGLGPSAVSYINGTRQRNVSELDSYINLSKKGLSVISSSERLPLTKRSKETAALKIRTKEGINFRWFKEKTGLDFIELEDKAIKKLVENGLLKYKRIGNQVYGVCLSEKGFLFCDIASSYLV